MQFSYISFYGMQFFKVKYIPLNYSRDSGIIITYICLYWYTVPFKAA